MIEPTYELVIYLVVRNDLKMGKGKIAVQCGHAIQYALERCQKPVWAKYSKDGSAKICLKVDTIDEFNDLKKVLHEDNIPHQIVTDAGRTQLEPGTQTCLGIGPISKELVQKYVQNLKLL